MPSKLDELCDRALEEAGKTGTLSDVAIIHLRADEYSYSSADGWAASSADFGVAAMRLS